MRQNLYWSLGDKHDASAYTGNIGVLGSFEQKCNTKIHEHCQPLHLKTFHTCWNTEWQHWTLANAELERQKRGNTEGERVRETHHSAFSDEPDACCYADRRAGKRRKRERSREKEGRQSMDVSLHWISSRRSGWSTGWRSHWKQQNGVECLDEDKEGRESGWGRGRTGIHLLNLLISGTSLSQHDSASFITFKVCTLLCVCVCWGACLNRNKFSFNWHCALLANSWSARKMCN